MFPLFWIVTLSHMILIQVCNWRKSHYGCMKTFKTSFQLFLYSTAWTFNVILNVIIFNSITPIVSAGVKLCGSPETSLILEVHLTYVILQLRNVDSCVISTQTKDRKNLTFHNIQSVSVLLVFHHMLNRQKSHHYSNH